jgi:hypothetical protein
MPEQPADVQRINWSSCFAFTQLFRTFKMALHPGKLGLALAAILAVGLWGTVLDGVWRIGHQRPLASEVNAYWREPDIGQWRQKQVDSRLLAVQGAFAQVNVPLDPAIQTKLKSPATSDEGIKDALAALDKAGNTADKAGKRPVSEWSTAGKFNQSYSQVESLQTKGIFESLWDYETSAIRQFIESAARLRFTEGLHDVIVGRRLSAPDNLLLGLARLGTETPEAYPPPDQYDNIGALGSLMLMVRGIQWLINEHPIYGVIFGLGKLAIFAFFGGAICRMAAMNFARDERIPLKTAVAFAKRKFVGFLTAPLLPIGMIVGLGALLALGGLIGSIPGLGSLLTGLLLFLALMAGFVMALVLIGFVGGGSLMWPTIAVEGSDSFDAMSRSYSYVYSRPWKAALYAFVATIYGALCYMFIRVFVYLMLWLARYFVGVGMRGTSRPGTGSPGGTKIDSLWPLPSFDELIGTRAHFASGAWDGAGQWLTHVWVGLVALSVGAFLVAFYFCASTIIYYLLRREVDATDLEDVYSEDVDEEAAGEGTAPAAAGATPAIAGSTATPGAAMPEEGTPPRA